MENLGTDVQMQQAHCICGELGGCPLCAPQFSSFSTPSYPTWPLNSASKSAAPFHTFGGSFQPWAHPTPQFSYTSFNTNNTSSQCGTFSDTSHSLSQLSFTELTALSPTDHSAFLPAGDTVDRFFQEPPTLEPDESGYDTKPLSFNVETNQTLGSLAPEDLAVSVINSTNTACHLSYQPHRFVGSHLESATHSATIPVLNNKKFCNHPRCTYEYSDNKEGSQLFRRHTRRNHENNGPFTCPKDGCSVTLTRTDNFKNHWASRKNCGGYDENMIGTEALKKKHKRYLRRFRRLRYRGSVDSSSEYSSTAEDSDDPVYEFPRVPAFLHVSTW